MVSPFDAHQRAVQEVVDPPAASRTVVAIAGRPHGATGEHAVLELGAWSSSAATRSRGSSATATRTVDLQSGGQAVLA